MSNDLDRIATAPAHVSQATAVEQARAVAEVQAAVMVAQQVPRDVDRALGDMRQSCGRMAVASRAFYAVKNRGSGPSVHLARELARIWGNVDYGVHELRRDDEAGMSEVRAFAWDQQTNVRSTRTFQVPHQRMKNGARQALVDLTDVYLNNQNIGARAVRECIFTVLPDDYVEEAKDLCRRTLENGEGTPLPERIDNMIATYKTLGVTLGQLEKRIGRKRGSWTAADVAQMGVTYTSIHRGETTVDDEFPEQHVTVDEITAAGPPPFSKDSPDPAPADTQEDGQ